MHGHLALSTVSVVGDGRNLCLDLWMACKTLSVDEEAYLRLVRAKRDPKESFSTVIKRARWESNRKQCGDLISRATGRVPVETLDYLDRAQANDLPPLGSESGGIRRSS